MRPILEYINEFEKLMAWTRKLEELAYANQRETLSETEWKSLAQENHISLQAYEVARVVAQRKRKLSLAD